MSIKYVKANLEALLEGELIDSKNVPGVTEITLSNEGQEEGVYVATVSAPAMSSYCLDENIFNVKISAATEAAETVVDKNTSGEIGQQCKLRVYEKEKPSVAFTNPQSDFEYIKDKSISVIAEMSDTSLGDIILDEDSGKKISKDSGINQDTVQMSVLKDGSDYPIDAETELTAELKDGKLIGTYTPTNGFSDGLYVVSLYVSDYDGNVSEVVERTFTIDSLAPQVTLTGPTGVVTKKEVTITGKTEADSTIEVIIIFNGQEYKTNPNEDGTFEYTITNVQDGTYIVSAKARDKAGNETPTATTLTIIVSTSTPVIESVQFTPVEGSDITQAKLYTIKVKVSLQDI